MLNMHISNQLARPIASQLEDMDVEADDYWGDCWGEDCIQSIYEDRYYTFDDWVYCNSLDCKSWFDDCVYEWWFDNGEPCYGINIVIQP
jgi:hypothetical protein